MNLNSTKDRSQYIFVPVKSLCNHNQFSAYNQFFISNFNKIFWNRKINMIGWIRQYPCEVPFFYIIVDITHSNSNIEHMVPVQIHCCINCLSSLSYHKSLHNAMILNVFHCLYGNDHMKSDTSIPSIDRFIFLKTASLLKI